MRLFQLSIREKRLFYIGCVLIAAALFINTIIVPLSEASTEMRRLINMKESILLKHQKMIARKGRTNELYAQCQKVLATTSSSEEVFTEILKEIQNSSKSFIDISDMTPKAVTQQADLKLLPVDLRFTCTMSHLTSFIHNLENSSSLLRITDLKLEANYEDQNKMKGKMTVAKLVFND